MKELSSKNASLEGIRIGEKTESEICSPRRARVSKQRGQLRG